MAVRPAEQCFPDTSDNRHNSGQSFELLVALVVDHRYLLMRVSTFHLVIVSHTRAIRS